jgi:sulfate permease, SulP family
MPALSSLRPAWTAGYQRAWLRPDLIAPALGVLVLTAEGVGVARALATKHGYSSDPNRDLVAMGASNLLSGFSSGFVQSGGASQTAAADGTGARSQLAAIIAGGFVLLTGAFLAPLFEDLPQATLAAIVIVAVSGFWDVASLRRFAHIRREAIAFAGLALAGPGPRRAAGPRRRGAAVARLRGRAHQPPDRDGARPRPGRRDVAPRRPPPRPLAARGGGRRAHRGAAALSERKRRQGAGPDARPRDVGSIDVLGELATEVRRDGRSLVLAEVRAAVRDILARAGMTDGLRIANTVDEALESPGPGDA